MDNVPGANRFIAQAYGGQPYPRDRNPIDSAYKLAQTGTEFRFSLPCEDAPGAAPGTGADRFPVTGSGESSA